MPRPKLVQGHPLDDGESPRRLIRVDEPTPEPEPEGHAFDQVSRVARADPRPIRLPRPRDDRGILLGRAARLLGL